MRKYIFILILLIPQILLSQTLEEMKEESKKNTAKAWNDLAEYYRNKKDTLQLRLSLEKAYPLLKNNLDTGRYKLYKACLNYQRLGKYTEIYNKEVIEAISYLKQGGDSMHLSYSYYDLAFSYINKAEYRKAIDALKLAIKWENSGDQANMYCQLARAYIDYGYPDSTMYCIEMAEKQAKIFKDTIALATAYNLKAISYRKKGEYALAIKSFQDTEQLYRAQQVWDRLCTCLCNIANLYIAWGRLDEAAIIVDNAYNEAVEHELPDSNMANILYIKACILTEKKQHKEALHYYLIADRDLNMGSYVTMNVWYAIAKSYLEMNMKDSAYYYVAKLENKYSKDNLLHMDSYSNIKGQLAFRDNKYSEAIYYFEKTIEIQKNKKGTTEGVSPTQLRNLSKSYELGPKNYKKALDYLNQAFDLQREVNKKENQETMADFYAKYETAQKDLEISQLNEREKELLYNRTLIITISIILLILLLLALLYSRYKRQQKEKEAILKDKRIEEKEYEYQTLLKESENKQMRNYLDGLEAERTRLAKELHDNVANELYVAALELGNLNIPEIVTNRMKDLHTQVRSISHDLMPPHFQYASLPDILYNHLIVLEKQTDIVFRLDIDNSIFFENIPTSLSHEIYRIIQECTGNIIKHSSAKIAAILLSHNETQLNLKVKDDGKGFNIKAIHKGIGLHIIEERCNSLGGDMHIDSEIGQGCTIEITIPDKKSIKNLKTEVFITSVFFIRSKIGYFSVTKNISLLYL